MSAQKFAIKLRNVAFWSKWLLGGVNFNLYQTAYY